LVSNQQNIEKNRPQITKEAQNVVFNLKGKIPLLFYYVKHTHRQLKTYLKHRNIHFKNKSRLLVKTLPWYSFKSILFCIFLTSQFVRYYLFWYIYVMFSLCCMVFRPLYCVFETCKVKSVKTLFRTMHIVLLFTLPNFSAISWKKKMLNRNYFLILSLVKKSFRFCVYIF
jgi:hypothetical protein